MYNFEFYGFSLLCYIQRECNPQFRKGFGSTKDGSSSNVLEVKRVLSYNCTSPEGKASQSRSNSGRPSKEGFVDFSKVEETRELDLAFQWFGEQGLSSLEVKALGDACYELGLAGVLWQVSQWTPARKRSALVMVDDNGPYWSRGTIIAASVSNDFLGRVRVEELTSSIIKVKSSTMERLCIRFNEIRQKLESEQAGETRERRERGSK